MFSVHSVDQINKVKTKQNKKQEQKQNINNYSGCILAQVQGSQIHNPLS